MPMGASEFVLEKTNAVGRVELRRGTTNGSPSSQLTSHSTNKSPPSSSLHPLLCSFSSCSSPNQTQTEEHRRETPDWLETGCKDTRRRQPSGTVLRRNCQTGRLSARFGDNSSTSSPSSSSSSSSSSPVAAQDPARDKLSLPRRSLLRHEMLYYEGLSQRAENQRLANEIRVLQESKQLEQCTFRPKLHSRTSLLDQTCSKPKGFASTVHRLRDARRKKLEPPEKPAPVSHPAGPFSFQDGRYMVRLAPEVFTLNVQVGKSQKGKLSIRQGEDPAVVIDAFCKIFALSSYDKLQISQTVAYELASRGISSHRTAVGKCK